MSRRILNFARNNPVVFHGVAFRFEGVAMRVIVAAVVAVSALYVADQQFTDGRYSTAAVQLIEQIKRSMGI